MAAEDRQVFLHTEGESSRANMTRTRTWEEILVQVSVRKILSSLSLGFSFKRKDQPSPCTALFSWSDRLWTWLVFYDLDCTSKREFWNITVWGVGRSEEYSAAKNTDGGFTWRWAM